MLACTDTFSNAPSITIMDSTIHLNVSKTVAIASNDISSWFVATVLAHDDGKEASRGTVPGGGGRRAHTDKRHSTLLRVARSIVLHQ